MSLKTEQVRQMLTSNNDFIREAAVLSLVDEFERLDKELRQELAALRAAITEHKEEHSTQEAIEEEHRQMGY